jgi:hypothetical protein
MSWIIRKKGIARSKVKVLGKEAMLAKAKRLLPNDVDFVTDEFKIGVGEQTIDVDF